MSADPSPSTVNDLPHSTAGGVVSSSNSERVEEVKTLKSSETTGSQLTPTSSDDWMEDLLLAGVKASVQTAPSPSLVRAKLIAEPPLPTWAEETSISEFAEALDQIADPSTNIDDNAANPDQSLDESTRLPQNLEMSHPLIEEEPDEGPNDHDQMVDNVFHGLNETLPEQLSVEDGTASAKDGTSEADNLSAEANAFVTDEVSDEAIVHEVEEDPVAAEIALALKQVEEEAAAEQLDETENPAPSPELEPAAIAESTDIAEEERTSTDQNESLSQEAISSLLAKFDDEDDLPATANAPKEASPKVTCPAGTPQPKINLAALKKKTGDDAPALAARLFGEGGEAGKAPEAERDLETNESAGLDEKPKERPLPVILLGLDTATDRLRRIHPMIPAALGILGGFLAVNGILTAVLASLGWI